METLPLRSQKDEKCPGEQTARRAERERMMKILNFGSVNIDYVFHVEEIARPGQTISSMASERYPGGKGFNQSLALSRAGAETFHAGTIGPDGLWLRRMLDEAGVDCTALRTVPAGTGSAFIQIDAGGQNCIVLNGGANRENTRAFCEETLERFSPGDILLLQNEINEVGGLIDLGSRQGMTVVLNPSPMNQDIFSYDLSRIDWFIMNEDEGQRLTGQEDPENILTHMTKKYPRSSTVLTLGEAGAAAVCQGRIFAQKAFPAKVVDTTGAGDTFTGFFLARLAAGDGIPACLETASLAASIAVSRMGAGPSIPTLEAVRARR